MSLFSQSDSGIVWSFPVLAGRLFDYVALLKPRVMSLVVFTAFTGMVIAPSHVDFLIGFASLFAIAAGAGASGALNMWYDADIDALMRRTRNRPIPASRMSKGDALCFGLVLAVLSVLALGLIANWLAAALLGFTIFFYVAIYTMWLKRATPQNIVIGGAAGALPPVIGCAAAAGDISLASLALFSIIFVWTPPHFWALALVRWRSKKACKAARQQKIGQAWPCLPLQEAEPRSLSGGALALMKFLAGSWRVAQPQWLMCLVKHDCAEFGEGHGIRNDNKTAQRDHDRNIA